MSAKDASSIAWRGLVLAAVLALASCVAPAPKPAAPTVTPAPTVAPAPKPAASPVKKPQPAKPAPAAPMTGGIALIEPQSFASEKARLKLTMAKAGGDAVITAELGYYLDVLLGRLKQVAARGVGITRGDDRIVLNVAGTFAVTPTNPQPEADLQNVLNPICKVLVEYRATLVSIHVKNDEPGESAADAEIAEQRALAVGQYFVKAGVSVKRILVVGSTNHVATSTEKTAESSGRAHVELELEPVERLATR